MSSDTSIRPLSHVLEDICQTIEKTENVTIGLLIDAFHERGFGIIMLIFAAPAALPIPGFNAIMSLPLICLALQQTMGRHTIWMPESLLHRPLPRQKMTEIIRMAIPWLKKIEVLIKPRMKWVTWNGPSHFMGFLTLLIALFAALPIPLTHTIPGISIAIIALGILMRDGLAIIAGTTIGIGWMAILIGSVVLFGSEAFDIITNGIKSVF